MKMMDISAELIFHTSAASTIRHIFCDNVLTEESQLSVNRDQSTYEDIMMSQHIILQNNLYGMKGIAV